MRFSCLSTGSLVPPGRCACFAKGASPQQEMRVVKAATVPVIRPMSRYPLAPSVSTTAPTTSPLRLAMIDPVKRAELRRVRIAVSGVSSVDRAA